MAVQPSELGRSNAEYLRDQRTMEARAEFARALRELSGVQNPSRRVFRVEKAPTGGFNLTETTPRERVLGQT